MEVRRLGSLRDRIRKNIKRDLSEMEARLGVKITTAAKKNLVSHVTSVFREDSPDIKKAGKLVRRRHYNLKGKRSESVLLVGEMNLEEKTRESIVEVIGHAAKLAATEEQGGNFKITSSHVSRAISQKWCSIYPVCNVRIGRKVGKKVR